MSGLDTTTLDALTAFGEHLGMCFQVVDDILDLTADAETLGKPSGNDLHEGVYTLPIILAAQESSELREYLGRQLDWDDVERARQLAMRGTAVSTAMQIARDHAAAARSALDSTSGLDADVCARLGGLVDGLVTRSF